MTWWTWIVLGSIVLGAELFLIDAQFYLVFIGLSAAATGALELLGVALPEWGQWLTFGALSLVSMFTFRKSLYTRIRGNAPGYRENVEGDTIIVENELAPGADGRASLRGAEWKIRNSGDRAIPAGARARVVRSEGLMLHVTLD